MKYIYAILLFPIISIAQNVESTLIGPMDQPNNIHYYLNRVAVELTAQSLDSINNLSDWEDVKALKRRQLVDMLGLSSYPIFEPRIQPHVVRVDTISEENFDIVKLYYESTDDLYVPANLYIPKNLKEAAPAVLYVCGHAHTQKHHYQSHARALADQGFVCLIIETLQRGEVRGEHLGAYENGWFQWYSRGYNPAGVEVWNGMRGIDLLSSLKEVDDSKIGVTGISGGGSQSWYLPAVDDRIMAAVAVAGAGSLEGQICQNTIDDHCDCMMPINTYQWDFSDIGGLIAPRPFVIAQTRHDGYYSIESVRTLYEKVSKIYGFYNAEENISMMEAPGGHSYGENEEMRSPILSFFLRELTGKKVSPEEIGALDISKKWSDRDLAVYVDGQPKNDRTLTIQETFVPKAEKVDWANPDELFKYRDSIKGELIAQTFAAFPPNPCAMEGRKEFSTRNFSKYGREIYSFVPEQGWRLKVDLRRTAYPKEELAPVILVLNSPNQGKWASSHLLVGRNKDANVAYFNARGIGETGWADDQQWHIRRSAAWLGRTIASMRVYDVLRCLDYLRSLKGVDPDEIHIAASGEMAVVAAYAALLDGRVNSLALENLPASQDVKGEPNGRGPALEMLNCLKITDIPEVLTCHFPNKILFIGDPPEAYDGLMKTYEKFGYSDSLIKLEK
ncbi:alpha/beta hydrolase family protein [Membranihabitans marinus]|uniref:alpha/beta hydrolase family protein n=1 Tax=Membranihabitans marinus TaxID=1227546 RepID=UPI001F340514|nr:acetylxylan esterase [Membranihabitans marinus]